MDRLQQSVFMNFSQVQRYQQRSKVLSDPRAPYARFRYEQVANEFDQLDINKNGFLSKFKIVNHLHTKYGEINKPLLLNILDSMTWKKQQKQNLQGNQGNQGKQQMVNREQFCKKWVDRQKNLYHQINQLKSMKNRATVMSQIYSQSKSHNPALYAKIKIERAYLKSKRKDRKNQEWADLQTQYQDHNIKLNYLIQQPSYHLQKPSFDLLLPVQNNYFFVRYNFYMIKKKELLGQCYVNIQISGKDLFRIEHATAKIIQNNQEVGICHFTVEFMTDKQRIQTQINQQSSNLNNAKYKAEQLQKEYQYIQFLWGVRYQSDHNFNQKQTNFVIGVRLSLAIALAFLSIILHVFGRSETLSFILSLLIAKNWQYVWLRSQKFLLMWMAIASLCLDFIWFSIQTSKISQINFMQLQASIFFTYTIVITKIMLLLYLLVKQSNYCISDQPSSQSIKQHQKHKIKQNKELNDQISH